MFTETLTQRQALAVAAPQAVLNNTSTYTGPGVGTLAAIKGINMSVVRRARAVFIIGAVAGGTLSYDLLASATNLAGSFTTIGAIVGTGGVTTTFPTTPALPVASTVISYEIRADQLPAGKPYLAAAAYATNAANITCAILLIGDESAYKPGSDQNATALAITNTVV